MFSHKSIVLGLLLLLASVLNGCDRRFAPQDLFEAYISDLNRSAYLDIDEDSEVKLTALPELRVRQLELSQFDVGLLDFLSLQQCEVGALAGQRNSILGRVMPASQRLIYELDMIRAIDLCEIENIDLRTKLQHIAQVKTNELPKVLSNLLWAGEETHVFFSLANGYLPIAPNESHYQDLIVALQHLSDFNDHLANVPHISSAAIEADMKAVYESRYLGKLLFSVSNLENYLRRVGQAVDTLSDSQDICGAPLTFLKKQFQRHYVDILQPYMARVNHVAYQVLPLINKLASSSPIGSIQWQAFIRQFSLDDDRSIWLRYLQASRFHGQAWSRLFSHCGEGIN